MLKFQEQVLLALTKIATNSDFQNLPWGDFRAISKIMKISKMLRKGPQGKF